MWLTTPDTIEHSLIERQLEPLIDDASDRSALHTTNHRGGLALQETLRNMPIVSIGKPKSWLLQDLYPSKKLSRLIQTQFSQSDFYLVRLSCSFRPVHKESRVEWARFRAVLLPHTSTGTQPTAFDLHPQQLVQEVKRQIKVTLSPSLKFQELEASIGSAEFGFEYTELIPLVSGAIGGSFDPSWDYTAHSDQDVQGTKWMHLLVEVPKGMTSGRALLELEADVLTKNGILPATLWRKREQESTQLTVNLWG
jgi:hypothetical protein